MLSMIFVYLVFVFSKMELSYSYGLLGYPKHWSQKPKYDSLEHDEYLKFYVSYLDPKSYIGVAQTSRLFCSILLDKPFLYQYKKGANKREGKSDRELIHSSIYFRVYIQQPITQFIDNEIAHSLDVLAHLYWNSSATIDDEVQQVKKLFDMVKERSVEYKEHLKLQRRLKDMIERNHEIGRFVRRIFNSHTLSFT